MAESALEKELAFHIQCASLPPPEREFKFHPVRKWRADFAWPDHRLLVEVEGGTYMQGRHNRGDGYEADTAKYNEAQLMGYCVLRFTGRQVRTGEALRVIERALSQGH